MHFLRRAILGYGAAMTTLAFASGAAAQERIFNIPAEDATEAIPEFARQAGVQIIAPGAQLKDVRTPQITGRQDVRGALAMLLQKTGLAVSADEGGVITIGKSKLKPARLAPPVPVPMSIETTLSTPQVQEVVVTGSHIARSNLDQPTPVSSLDLQQLRDAGTANLSDIIAQLPAVGAFSTTRANSGNGASAAGPGVAEIDLRNLGASRTLVLVDGQRHVNGDVMTDAVDVNSIPAALVDRVEVITGGASAVYGSDAVSGVVNIILKHNFQGLDLQVQGGNYDQAFGAQESAYALAGHTFDVAGGRLNLTFAGFYNNEAGILGSDLPYNRNYSTITNPRDLSGALDPTFLTTPPPRIGDGTPDNLVVPNVGSEFISRNGVLLNPTTGLPIVGFLNNGQPVSQPARTGFNSALFGQLPGCGQSCYFPDPVTSALDPNQQRGVELLANYDVNSHLHAFVDAKFVDTLTTNDQQGDFTFGANSIAADNAFIPAQLQGVLAPIYAQGLEPSYAAFLSDNEVRQIERRTYRVVAGVSGLFNAPLFDLKYSSALNYGQELTHNDLDGAAITNNLAAALDSVINPSTGLPACRINVPSAQGSGYVAPAVTSTNCAPYNPFGSGQSTAAQAYVLTRLLARDHLSQEVANINFNTDTHKFLKLQGGPISLALGGEYRQERTYENNDQNLLDGETDVLGANSAGGYNVYEGYAEVNAPLLRHFSPGLDELSFDAAYREAHYSTVGDVSAYKASAIYGPVSWLKLRGTYSRSVRAPDITQAFSPTQGAYFNVVDPCSSENVVGNVNYGKNCAAAGVPSDFTAQTNVEIKGQSSGNALLTPERSLSYTGGLILEPPFIPHLSITADYYSILITDAITQVAAQDVVNNCYNNGSGLNAQFCGLFTRDPTTHNIGFIESTYVNASKIYTDGVEIEGNYAFSIGDYTRHLRYLSNISGALNITADLNYVVRLRNYPFQDNPSQYNVLEGGITTQEGDVPKLRGLVNTVYRQGPVQVSWQVRYLGRAARYDQDPTQADFSESTDQPYAGAKFFHDVAVRYDLSGWAKGFQVFIGVNDLFGETPPLGLVQYNGSDAAYDLGRYIFGGVRYRR